MEAAVHARGLALVTGAGGGIGLEVATRLARRGHAVLAVERDPELAASAAAMIRQSAPGSVVAPVSCDLADRTAVRALTHRIATEWAPHLDVVVLNAGLVIPGHVVDLAPEDLDGQIDVMLGSAMHVAQAAARAMVDRGSGHVLATVSTGGMLALPGSAAYSAAKAGLRAFLAALSHELRGTGVAVSGVYPSAVDTPMLEHEARNGGTLLNFVGKVSTAVDVANAYDRALRTKRLETYLPYADSVFVRALECVPWAVPALLGPLNALGRRGRRTYLRRKAEVTGQ